ncbi:hypothetical protein Aasi_1039 [Candidatus Amoebophilus asiaticus 5a2]|uniref:Uncharacterized protein n=2 Tax=Candidatus Amoebophilus asiaticus TaxID=281120 RepID=B3ET35_AMOA5|nr:hypothetical protein Aasi_1039 [Candidatus Amoebophilus asiaticus 5a2]
MQVYQMKNSWWQKTLYYLYHLPQNIYSYSKYKVEKYGAEYTPFAFFMAFNYMIPLFMGIQPGNNSIYVWLLIVKTIGVSLCIGLLLRSYWAEWFQKYFPIYWHFTLFYCIPFSFTLLFLMNGSNIQSLLNVALASMLLILLVDWTTFLSLSLAGSIIGIWFYAQFIDKIPVLDLYDLYIIFQVCVFSMVIGLIFGRRREIYMDFMSKGKYQLRKTQQEAFWEVAALMQYRETLLQELNPDKGAISNDIIATYMQQAICRMANHMQLDITLVNLKELLKEVGVSCNSTDLKQSQLYFKKETEKDVLRTDVSKLKQLLFNAINYIGRDHSSNPINVVIKDSEIKYNVANIETPGSSKLPALEIVITKEFLQPSKSQLPLYMIDLNLSSGWLDEQENDPLLIENAYIIDTQYGYVAKQSSQTLVYILPVSLPKMQYISTQFFNKYTEAKI